VPIIWAVKEARGGNLASARAYQRSLFAAFPGRRTLADFEVTQ
jgi:hypothetical protein